MKIKSIGANQTEVTLANGNVILVSYQTPIAIMQERNGANIGAYVSWHWDSDKKCNVDNSKTTKKHIKSFLARHNIGQIWSTTVISSDLQRAIDDGNNPYSVMLCANW